MIARFLGLVAWFLCGVALAFVWLVPAYGETIPATPVSGAATVDYGNPTWGYHSSSSTACTVARGGETSWSVLGGEFRPQFVYRCNYSVSGIALHKDLEYRYSCPGSGTWTETAPGSATCSNVTAYQCPSGQGWTLSGQQCTRPDCDGFTETRDSAGVCRHCIAGHYRSQLQYYSYPDPSPDRNYAILTGNSGPGGDVPATACYDGCTVDLANSTDYRYSGGGGPSGHWTFNGAPKQTGAACSAGGGSDAAPVPEKTPEANCVASGMSYGTVNGTVVCVPHGTTQERKVSETTGPGGGKTTTTETRVCTGGSCNSTTTVTNVGGGSAGGQADGTTTTETKGDQSGALQGDGESECEVNPLSSACLGGPAEREVMASGSGGGGSGIQAVALGGGAFCPADSVVTIAGRTVAIPWTHACQLCGYVRPLVVLFGWLIAGYFVVSGLRS